MFHCFSLKHRTITLYPYGPQNTENIIFRIKPKESRQFGHVGLKEDSFIEAKERFKKWVENY